MDAFRTPFDKPDSPGTDDSAGREPSSATGIFGTVSTPPARSEEDLLASLSRERDSVVSDSVKPAQTPSTTAPTPQASASPGDFTRMLQSLATPEEAGPSGSSSVSQPSQELARAFSQFSFEKVPSPEPASRAEVPTEPARPVSPLAEKSGAASPGSFTQMFSSMSAEPAGPAAMAPPASAAQPLRASGASAPGEFTKMFQGAQGENGFRESSMPAAPPPEPLRSTEPGAFTRMFSRDSLERAPQQDPLKSLKAEPIPEKDFKFTAGPARPAEPALPAQGGFTQLLQALNQEPAAKASEPLLPAAPLAAPTLTPAPAAGGFTQLLRTLSAEPVSPPQAAPSMAQSPVAPPAAPPMSAPPMVPPQVVPPMMPQTSAPPPVQSGPGEFTRIISGSALRDLQGQNAVPAAQAPPVAAAPMGQPGWPPVAIPQAPAVPHAPPFVPPSFAFPPAPAPPPAAAPVPPPAPAPGALQKYMPLILVLNVFLMLAIVLILVFTLHHK